MLTTTQEIIEKFEEYIGDATALSSVAEVELADKIYQTILGESEWQFLIKEATGSVNGTTIAQPADFKSLLSNPFIYLGDNYNPFQVVPFQERRVYRGTNNTAYYDARLEQFVFIRDVNNTYSFDYIYQPDALDTSGSNPVWPARFNYAIVHLMCIDSDIMELSEKARSYAPENSAAATKIIAQMQSWSMNISNMRTYGN